MRVFPEDIPEEGLYRTLEIGPKGMAADVLAPRRLDGPLMARLELTRIDGNIRMRGRIEGDLLLDCERCLKEFGHEVDLEIDVTCSPSPDDLPEELQLGAGDLEVVFYVDSIDLGRVVIEHALLSLPMTAVCDENCKGICSGCGADLNDGECVCGGRDADPRWDKLKDWRQGG